MGGGRAGGRPVRAPERQLRPDFPRRSILFAAVVASARKEPKSKYTADRQYPGRLRGRDGHPAALHDAHRERRRRRRGDVLHAARARLRRRLRAVRPAAGPLGGRRQARGLPGRHLHPQGHHLDDRHRRGRQDHGLHAPAQRQDRQAAEPAGLRRAGDRDLHALHAPRLPGPLRPGLAALHLPVPRRRLRLPGHRRRRPAGAPARPLLHARARRHRRGRPALLGQLRAQALRLLPRPGAGPRRHRPVPLSRRASRRRSSKR